MKRSILYLVPDLFGPPGGIARYCQLVCRSLLEAGIPLRVFSLRDKPSANYVVDSAFSGISYQPCYGSRKSFVVLTMKAVIIQRPGFIFAGHPNFAPLGFCLSKLSGAPYVVFIYGLDVWQELTPLRKWTLRNADRIISISRFTAQQAIQINGVAPDRIRVLYNCLDPTLDQSSKRSQTRTELSMLTVARMHPLDQYKGHAYVIRAMPYLRARFPNLVYDVVGDGPGRTDLQRLAAEVGVAEAVRFHGLVSEEALVRYYANADVFIMPSTGEGFGFVFLEAMAQGTPAIGGNRDATPEVIIDGETGFLVDPNSIESIVNAVSRLLGDEPLRLRMGQAAERHVRQNFSYSAFYQTLQQHIRELLVTPGRAREFDSV